MLAELLCNLLLAHLVSDFWLQTNRQVLSKKKFGFRGGALYIHALTIALVSYLLSADFRFWPFAALLFAAHGVIDRCKLICPRRLWAFAMDQILHVLSICFVSKWFILLHPEWSQFEWIPAGVRLSVPALACAIVFCTSPANFLIREILAEFRINTSARESGKGHRTATSRLRNAGALIGALERLLILLFVFVGNFEAAGLTIAAKSILRFRDDEGPRTEFVLVGTLLSFVIAVVAAVAVLVLAFDCKNLK